MSKEQVVALINDLDQKVEIAMSNLSVYTNGSGELFIKIKDGKTYRMAESDGKLHIVANNFTIKQYGGCNGIVVS